jgi:hypothetical protein
MLESNDQPKKPKPLHRIQYMRGRLQEKTIMPVETTCEGMRCKCVQMIGDAVWKSRLKKERIKKSRIGYQMTEPYSAAPGLTNISLSGVVWVMVVENVLDLTTEMT